MNACACCRYSKRFLRRLLVLSGCIGVGLYSISPSLAVDVRSVQIHGFASQGFTLTDNNNFFGESTGNGSFEATELGLNASWRMIPELQVSGQLLWRKAGDIGDNNIRLDYGLIDYRFFSNERHHHGLRIGRIKNPLGLYNDTRDVAFTRPGVTLPQSIYFERTRDLALSSDGGELYGEVRFDTDALSWELVVAQPRARDLDTEIATLGGDRPGKLEPRTSFLGRLFYDYSGGRLRLAISNARLNLEYQPGASDPSGNGTIRFSPTILSAQFNTESWSFTGEYARRPFMFGEQIIYVPAALKSIVGQSYYLQSAYRLTEKWELMGRYDITYQNTEDKSGEKFSALTAGTIPAHSQFSKDWTVGVRWSPSPPWMVRAEHHWVNGTAWLPLQDNPDRGQTQQRWRLFAVLASFRF